jgi:hypothetical protein
MISVSDAFSPLRSALEGAGIRYAIGGSWASAAFGEPRFTNDPGGTFGALFAHTAQVWTFLIWHPVPQSWELPPNWKRR